VQNLNAPKGWTLDIEKDYIAFSEGNYYAVNQALVYRITKKEVVQRNTFTGKEKVLSQNMNKTRALKLMREYVKTSFQRL
jgi:hypothetical protein